MIFYKMLTLHPILIAAAVIPAIALMVYIYRKDRLEKEPRGLLILLVVFGILSTAMASFAERIGATILARILNPRSELFAIISNFVVIGLVEELSKYLFLRWRTWNDVNFNCRFDGLVYAVFVSLGFALWENIYYVIMYGLGGAMLRAVTAIPGHACFGVFMGVWYGHAKQLDRQGQTAMSKTSRRLAVIIPSVLHGFYDYIATKDTGNLTVVFAGFILLLFALSFLAIRKYSKEDRYF